MPSFQAPRLKATGTPTYSPPKLPAPPIYRWGQSNPALAASSGAYYNSQVAAAKAPAAGGPAAPGAPASTSSSAALPPDATYDQILAALVRKRDTTVGQLAGQRASTLLDYGYSENPATGALTYDLSNPESRAAQLKKHYDQSRSGAGINMAARGQLYAGSYQNAQDELNAGQVTDEDKLSKALQAYLSTNTASKAGAQTDYELGAAQAYGDRVGRASTNPLYTPTPDQPPPTLKGLGGQSIPDGTYSAKSAPAGLVAQGVKIAPGYVVVVQGGKVVQIRKQR